MTGDDDKSAASRGSTVSAEPSELRRSRMRRPRLAADAGLFASAESEIAAIAAPGTVARAHELARSGLYATIDAIAGQLKAEQMAEVDVLLFDAAIRKALRQACAEGRMALLRQGRAG